jgi:aspartyl-tRNA(Asn)/glutamyl-tRNA(Gln) amidotransferase subunit C
LVYSLPMSDLTMRDLDHVIALSHLAIEPSRKEAYLAKLQQVLTYMDQLKQVDVEGVSPSSHALAHSTRLREDVVVAQPELLLEKNAPLFESHAFRVPKILG